MILPHTHNHSPFTGERSESAQQRVYSTACQTGFTLVEVMIAVAVMTIGMFGVLSMIPTLSSARTQALEMVMVRQIASSLAERIQGATWRELGGTQQNPGSYNTEAWSLPRYREGTQINPPMTQSDTNPYHHLVSNGMLAQIVGIPDLKVYLEYYDGRIMTGTVNRQIWYESITGTVGRDNRMFTFSDVGAGAVNSVVIRILVTWREQNGVPVNTHEIFTARKR